MRGLVMARGGFRRFDLLTGESRGQKQRRWATERRAAAARKIILDTIERHRQLRPGALEPRLVRPEGWL
jgi:hypothetical protein